MVRVSVNPLPFTNRDVRRQNYSIGKLIRYRPPFVANAEKEISKMLGGADLHSLEKNHALISGEVLELQSKGDVTHAKEILASPLFGASDYLVRPILFWGINTAVLKCVGIRGLGGKKILQVAPNWGPYMYYLKHEYGAVVSGVDNNNIAVEYAKLGGLDFTMGSAGKMDFFPDNSFDLVISRNFLESSYLNMFFFNKFYRDPSPFMNDVIREIHRVLKPGGIFFSQYEDTGEMKLAYDIFSSFDRLELSGFDAVHILQK
jgi:SAM-dependent methyltransferase